MEPNNPNNDSNLETDKENVKEFKDFWYNTKHFFLNLLEIKSGTDRKETIQKIKDGISVKNHTAWVLIFSIIIASIGLNLSSIPIVIGAMLVSPLMGPILGIGLSVGINDIDTLDTSLVFQVSWNDTTANTLQKQQQLQQWLQLRLKSKIVNIVARLTTGPN